VHLPRVHHPRYFRPEVGKHKDHDVKTIKKAHPAIKAELDSHLDKIESAVENLLIRKSEVEKNIRNLNDQNNQAKGQIQKAFEEVRNVLAIKEK
jgi:archaellum component FlaC